jgi:hypothetical protein
LECWGENGYGQAPATKSASSGSFTQFDAGNFHTCALRSDGVVECWGDNRSGEAPATKSASSGSFTQVDAGDAHTCALRDDGIVECWGDNLFGESPATKSASSGGFIQVATGQSHACALRDDGVVECWGYNAYGQAPAIRLVSGTFSFGGFLAPVQGPPTLNIAKAGGAVPVKFGLGADRGLNIFLSGSPSSVSVTCNSGAPTGTVNRTATAGNSVLSYDASSDTYSYSWKTDKAWAATCRRLTMRFVDGTVANADFQFIK